MQELEFVFKDNVPISYGHIKFQTLLSRIFCIVKCEVVEVFKLLGISELALQVTQPCFQLIYTVDSKNEQATLQEDCFDQKDTIYAWVWMEKSIYSPQISHTGHEFFFCKFALRFGPEFPGYYQN